MAGLSRRQSPSGRSPPRTEFFMDTLATSEFLIVYAFTSLRRASRKVRHEQTPLSWCPLRSVSISSILSAKVRHLRRYDKPLRIRRTCGAIHLFSAAGAANGRKFKRGLSIESVGQQPCDNVSTAFRGPRVNEARTSMSRRFQEPQWLLIGPHGRRAAGIAPQTSLGRNPVR